MEPKVSHLHPVGRGSKFPVGWSGNIREFVWERDRNRRRVSAKKHLRTRSSPHALPLRTYGARERRVVPSLCVRRHGYRETAFCQMRVQIGYEKSVHCIREGFYMDVWIMDYVLQFFAFSSFKQSSQWSVQTFYSLFEKSEKFLCHFCYKPAVCYNLPGGPASALNSAGLVVSSSASSTEGNDADDPSALGSVVSAAHVSKPSAATKLLSVLDYHHYMTHLLAIEETAPLSSSGTCSLETSPTIKGRVSQALCSTKKPVLLYASRSIKTGHATWICNVKMEF